MVRFGLRAFLLSVLVLLAFLVARHRADLWAIPLIPFSAYLLAAAPVIGAGYRETLPLAPAKARRLGRSLLVWAIVLLALPAMALIPLYYAMKSPEHVGLHAFAAEFATVAVDISQAGQIGYGSFTHTGELGPGGPAAYATALGLAAISAALFQVIGWTYIAGASRFSDLAETFVNRSPKEHAKLFLFALGLFALLYFVARSPRSAADGEFGYDCRGCVFWQIPPLAIPLEVLLLTVLWIMIQGAAALLCAAAYRAFHGPILSRPGD